MACYRPLNAWRSWRAVSVKTGKPSIFFKKQKVLAFPEKDREELKLPCGRCDGCLLDRARSWAVRCVHEASLYDENCFITLTYNDEFCPKDGLVKCDFQNFMKRFRKSIEPRKVRYYMCGEYGSNFGRPHFHACVFNFDFTDKVFWSERDGIRLYRSPTLERLWSDPDSKQSLGFSTVGAVTFESAAYVARYVMKKVFGVDAEHHYNTVDEQGNFHYRLPEYTSMSLKPGIARAWIDSYKASVYPHDHVVLSGGFKIKPPRYYDKQYELTDPVMSSTISQVRKERALQSSHNTPARLAAREKVKRAQIKMLKRSL